MYSYDSMRLGMESKGKDRNIITKTFSFNWIPGFIGIGCGRAVDGSAQLKGMHNGGRSHEQHNWI